MVYIIIGAVVVVLAIVFLCLWFYMGMGDSRVRVEPDMSKTRVACVGDSITYGCLVEGRKKNNYPKKLGELLGDAYQVENFGLTNRTVCNFGDNPYRLDKVKEYDRSLKFNSDIVVFMMGTNDSKAKNWKTKEDFYSEYDNLLKLYRTSGAKVYLCTPAAAYGLKGEEYGYGIREDNLITIRQIVKDYANEYSLGLIDIAEATKNHKELFAMDGIHPNAKGAKLLADTIYNAIVKDA